MSSSGRPRGHNDWEALADWWVAELEADPAYAADVVPLLWEVLGPEPGGTYLDVGCGEGRLLRELTAAGARAWGCDMSMSLLGRSAGSVVQCRLPDLSWAAPAGFDGAYSVLVLEHLEELETLFAEVWSAVRPGGMLAVVMNHPVYTTPAAGPLLDPDDGEVLWRWGRYTRPEASVQPAGDGTMVFHHRPLGAVLGAAAAAGWCLQALVERPLTGAGDPVLAAQSEVPRLAGLRWKRPE